MKTVNIHWDDTQKTIIRFEFEKEWTWDDFYESLDEAYEWLDSVQHPVGFMALPHQNALYVPPGVMSHLNRLTSRNHPNLTITVIVSAGSFVNSMLSVLIRLNPLVKDTYRFVNTPDEARAIIQEMATAHR